MDPLSESTASHEAFLSDRSLAAGGRWLPIGAGIVLSRLAAGNSSGWSISTDA